MSLSKSEKKEKEYCSICLSINDERSRTSSALLGRSLLQENKDLYDAANRVYQTRNRVVHKELTFSDNSPRFSGLDEAIEAIRCAAQLAAWFGVTADYAHPFDGVQGLVCTGAKRWRSYLL